MINPHLIKSACKFDGGGLSFYQDNHWRPQKDFVGPRTVIFKYEELKYEAWADLRMRFNLGDLASEFTDLPLDKPDKTQGSQMNFSFVLSRLC